MKPMILAMLMITFSSAFAGQPKSTVASMDDVVTGGSRTLIYGDAAETIYNKMSDVVEFYVQPESSLPSCIRKTESIICQRFTQRDAKIAYSCAFVTTPSGEVINGYRAGDDRSQSCPN